MKQKKVLLDKSGLLLNISMGRDPMSRVIIGETDLITRELVEDKQRAIPRCMDLNRAVSLARLFPYCSTSIVTISMHVHILA